MHAQLLLDDWDARLRDLDLFGLGPEQQGPGLLSMGGSFASAVSFGAIDVAGAFSDQKLATAMAALDRGLGLPALPTRLRALDRVDGAALRFPDFKGFGQGLMSLGASFASGFSLGGADDAAALGARLLELDRLQSAAALPAPDTRFDELLRDYDGLLPGLDRLGHGLPLPVGLSMVSFASVGGSFAGADAWMGRGGDAGDRLAALEPLDLDALLRDFAEPGGVGWAGLAGMSMMASVVSGGGSFIGRGADLELFNATLPHRAAEGAWGLEIDPGLELQLGLERLHEFDDLGLIGRLIATDGAGVSMASFSSALSFGGGAGLFDDRLADILTWDPLGDVDFHQAAAAGGGLGGALGGTLGGGLGIDSLRDFGDLGDFGQELRDFGELGQVGCQPHICFDIDRSIDR